MKNFKTFMAAFFAVAFFAISGFTTSERPAKAMAWTIDKAHSNLAFDIRHIFTPVTGEFLEYDGSINFDPKNLEESAIDITIQVASLDTDNERRNGHLLSGDFFNAEKYPTITFTSNKITADGDNQFVAHGELTIKDVTKEIELPFTLLGVKDHPMQENAKVAGITSDLTINRNEFNVGVGDWASTAIVGDEVSIELALELNHTM